jgi:hypothetical protein
MNRDFSDMLSALSVGEVEWLVVRKGRSDCERAGFRATPGPGGPGLARGERRTPNPNSEPRNRWRASRGGGSWGA